MKFKEIIGQEEIKKKLLSFVHENRVSHAMLFHGNPGIGKLPLAIAFAQYLSCTNRHENDACGTCPSCNKYNKLIHPDLHFVFPVKKISPGKSISDNHIKDWREMVIETPYFTDSHWFSRIGLEKQGSIYNDETYEIIRKLSLKPFESEYKVMIIWLPEMMNTTSANKLLKLLEEPPEKTLFLLVSENINHILPTILSRAQLVRIPPVSNVDIEQALLAKFYDREINAPEIAKVASGNVLKAFEMVETGGENENFLELFIQLMRNSYKKNLPGIIAGAEELAALKRERIKSFLEYALHLLRENFVMNYSEKDLNYMTFPEKDFSQNFHPFINENNIFDITSEIDRAHYHIEANGNEKIVMLDFSLKMLVLIKPN